jgi:hypothetical protein
LRLLHPTIDFTPVSHADDKYYQQIIFDPIDDSVVADPYAENPAATLDGLRCRRTWALRQALNPLLKPPLIGFGKFIQLAICGKIEGGQSPVSLSYLEARTGTVLRDTGDCPPSKVFQRR